MLKKKNKQNDPLDPLDWGRGGWKSQSDASVPTQVSVFLEWDSMLGGGW